VGLLRRGRGKGPGAASEIKWPKRRVPLLLRRRKGSFFNSEMGVRGGGKGVPGVVRPKRKKKRKGFQRPFRLLRGHLKEWGYERRENYSAGEKRFFFPGETCEKGRGRPPKKESVLSWTGNPKAGVWAAHVVLAWVREKEGRPARLCSLWEGGGPGKGGGKKGSPVWRCAGGGRAKKKEMLIEGMSERGPCLTYWKKSAKGSFGGGERNTLRLRSVKGEGHFAKKKNIGGGGVSPVLSRGKKGGSRKVFK